MGDTRRKIHVRPVYGTRAKLDRGSLLMSWCIESCAPVDCGHVPPVKLIQGVVQADRGLVGGCGPVDCAGVVWLDNTVADATTCEAQHARHAKREAGWLKHASTVACVHCIASTTWPWSSQTCLCVRVWSSVRACLCLCALKQASARNMASTKEGA